MWHENNRNSMERDNDDQKYLDPCRATPNVQI